MADLDLDLNESGGTTQQRFTQILSEATQEFQARVLQGMGIQQPTV
jgi:hypothetical protein